MTTTETVKSKRTVTDDMSGWCRHSGRHELCRAVWETPSAIVRCACACHVRRVMAPKGPRAGTGVAGRKMVPKK